MAQILNSSQVSYFILAAYIDTGSFKWLYFLVFLSLYVSILFSNVLLIVVICVNRSLHEPMYLFLCSLFVNELYGSTGLFPFLLLQILSDVHTVSASCCFLQIFCVHSYGSVEFANLAVMAYDRYLAICCPLQYGSRMTVRKVLLLTAIIWSYSFVAVGIMVLLTASLQLCGNSINKVVCLNYPIVKLSCSDISVNNIYGLFVTVLTVLCPPLLICYSYVRILQVCFSGSRQVRQKAVSTCSPHLASLLNFSIGCCIEILQSRFDVKSDDSMLEFALGLYFLVFQPLLNPLMYGIRLTKIRSLFKHLLCTCGLT